VTGVQTCALPISTLLDIAAIRIDGGTQPRAAIDQAYVNELAEALRTPGLELPPVHVVADGAVYWLVDGFHRWHGHRAAKRAKIQALVTQGSLEDARWQSFAANREQDHIGLRRTNAEKQRAVLAALAHPKGRTMSDRAIAEHVGVGHNMVSVYRKQLSSKDSCLREGRDGRTRDVSNIGRRREPDLDPVPSFYDDDPAPAEVQTAEPQATAPAAAPARPKDAEVRDQVGRIVPPGPLVELFERRDELTRLMTEVSRLKSAITEAVTGQDPLYGHIQLARIQADLQNVFHQLRFARPHAVCPYCGGQGCRTCASTGFVGEILYERYTPEELKR
jgi:hypothetical protein